MSETPSLSPEELSRLRRQLLRIYEVVAGLSVFGILVLVAYSIRLGPIVGPGVESSFGLAVALMFLEGALLVHIVDRIYREWPLGRRVAPDWRGAVSDADIARFLMVIVFAAALGSVAFLFWGILGS